MNDHNHRFRFIRPTKAKPDNFIPKLGYFFSLFNLFQFIVKSRFRFICFYISQWVTQVFSYLLPRVKKRQNESILQLIITHFRLSPNWGEISVSISRKSRLCVHHHHRTGFSDRKTGARVWMDERSKLNPPLQCTVKSRFNESRFNVKSWFKEQNLVTKMKFYIKKSRFSVKSQFKEWKGADGGIR